MTPTGTAPPRQALGMLTRALHVQDFTPLPDPPVSSDPLGWPGYPAQLLDARRRTGAAQAVIAGHARIGGQRCVLAVFSFDFLGGSMGAAEGELLARAIDCAQHRGLPLVTVARSGGARMQEGPLSLLQMSRVAGGLARLAAAGVPHVAVVDDPTTGGVWAALVAAADIVLGRAGAQVAFAGTRLLPGVDRPPTASTAEGKHALGFLDAVVADHELTDVLAGYLNLLSPATRGEPSPPPPPQLAPEQPTQSHNGWGSVQAARSSTRRTAQDYLARYLSDRQPLWGDRVGGVDSQVDCGFGRREGRTIAYVCQRGGPVGAAGFRTAHRLLALADRLHLPIVTFVDTAGADNSPEAERHGVGTAIAMLLQQLAATTAPVLSVVVGQGVSGGAIALINPDNMWMAPDSYLAVTAPEAAAAILKRQGHHVPQLAEQLALSPAAVQQLHLSRGMLTP